MKPEMMRIADSQQEGLGFHQQNCHAVATFENLAQRWPWAIAPLGQCAELAEEAKWFLPKWLWVKINDIPTDQWPFDKGISPQNMALYGTVPPY